MKFVKLIDVFVVRLMFYGIGPKLVFAYCPRSFPIAVHVLLPSSRSVDRRDHLYMETNTMRSINSIFVEKKPTDDVTVVVECVVGKKSN